MALGSPKPDFALPVFQGGSITLSELRGRNVVFQATGADSVVLATTVASQQPDANFANNEVDETVLIP